MACARPARRRRLRRRRGHGDDPPVAAADHGAPHHEPRRRMAGTFHVASDPWRRPASRTDGPGVLGSRAGRAAAPAATRGRRRPGDGGLRLGGDRSRAVAAELLDRIQDMDRWNERHPHGDHQAPHHRPRAGRPTGPDPTHTHLLSTPDNRRRPPTSTSAHLNRHKACLSHMSRRVTRTDLRGSRCSNAPGLPASVSWACDLGEMRIGRGGQGRAAPKPSVRDTPAHGRSLLSGGR